MKGSWNSPPRRWLAAALAAFAVVAAGNVVRGREAGPLRVCLVSGSLEYHSNESLAELQTYLEANYNVRCSRAFMEGEDDEHLIGLENLEACDVALLFTRRLKLTGDQLERIKSYCLSGKPLVGVRTASHAIQTWLELDKEVLGGNYKGHYRSDLETDVAIVADAKGHPVLAGVRPFRSAGSLYKNRGLADDCRVLMQGTSPEATEPIAWTRPYKGGRVFYTSLGHPKDFEHESFRRLLANALFWTAGREPEPTQGN
jgi:type 1 glutamine amidotransferase